MQRAMRGYRPSTGSADVPRHNVGRMDRWISAALGAMTLARLGRRHGSVGKAIAATAGTMLLTRAATGHSRVYDALGVSSATLGEGAGIDVTTSVTIKRPREELYAFWRDVTNLPLVMTHLESVEDKGMGVTHWRARGPKNVLVEWDAEIINEKPGEYLAWESMPGSKIDHAGSVHFRDVGDEGTEVLVRMRYAPQGMVTRFALAKLMNPLTEAEIAEDLRRFKHTMETSVDITAEGRPTGA